MLRNCSNHRVCQYLLLLICFSGVWGCRHGLPPTVELKGTQDLQQLTITDTTNFGGIFQLPSSTIPKGSTITFQNQSVHLSNIAVHQHSYVIMGAGSQIRIGSNLNHGNPVVYGGIEHSGITPTVRFRFEGQCSDLHTHSQSPTDVVWELTLSINASDPWATLAIGPHACTIVHSNDENQSRDRGWSIMLNDGGTTAANSNVGDTHVESKHAPDDLYPGTVAALLPRCQHCSISMCLTDKYAMYWAMEVTQDLTQETTAAARVAGLPHLINNAEELKRSLDMGGTVRPARRQALDESNSHPPPPMLPPQPPPMAAAVHATFVLEPQAGALGAGWQLHFRNALASFTQLPVDAVTIVSDTANRRRQMLDRSARLPGGAHVRVDRLQRRLLQGPETRVDAQLVTSSQEKAQAVLLQLAGSSAPSELQASLEQEGLQTRVAAIELAPQAVDKESSGKGSGGHDLASWKIGLIVAGCLVAALLIPAAVALLVYRRRVAKHSPPLEHKPSSSIVDTFADAADTKRRRDLANTARPARRRALDESKLDTADTADTGGHQGLYAAGTARSTHVGASAPVLSPWRFMSPRGSAEEALGADANGAADQTSSAGTAWRGAAGTAGKGHAEDLSALELGALQVVPVKGVVLKPWLAVTGNSDSAVGTIGAKALYSSDSVPEGEHHSHSGGVTVHDELHPSFGEIPRRSALEQLLPLPLGLDTAPQSSLPPEDYDEFDVFRDDQAGEPNFVTLPPGFAHLQALQTVPEESALPPAAATTLVTLRDTNDSDASVHVGSSGPALLRNGKDSMGMSGEEFTLAHTSPLGVVQPHQGETGTDPVTAHQPPDVFHFATGQQEAHQGAPQAAAAAPLQTRWPYIMPPIQAVKLPPAAAGSDWLLERFLSATPVLAVRQPGGST